eukprot:scaffold331331_cov96-Cyclotella_meneghiniana.AAC.4
MDEPYGGTPFVEITSSLNDSADNGIVARSFLSMGHTRKGNDLISKGRQKGHRIYRPVPLLLHIFCVRTDDNGYGIDTLEGCTFGTDTFDLWHEVESPEFLLETKWKKTVRKARSISFPYDLHIFRQNNIMRMGLVYEDCYSVYQDYEIDFDAISGLQQTHPMRIALQSGYTHTDGAQEANTIAFSPTLVQSTSTHCLSRYSHTGEEKLYVTPVAEEDDLAKRIANHTWIVTHQYKQMPIRKRLKLNNILSKASSSRNDIQELGSSQLDAILRHYPYPIKQRTDKKNNNTLIAPTLCIYVYGSIPSFTSLEQLLSHPDDDSTGIMHQFESFLTADYINYPVVLVKDQVLIDPTSMRKLNKIMAELGHQEDMNMLQEFYRPKSTSLESITNSSLRESFRKRFSALNDVLESQPMIRVILPNEEG